MRAMRLPAAVAACALLTTTGYAPHLPPEGQTTGQWPTVEQTTNVDDEDTRATEPDPPEEVVDAHMEALAAGSDPHRMREGLALVEEDSPAHDYLIHHIFRGPNPEKIRFFADHWVKQVEKTLGGAVEIRGPVPSPIEKVKDEYRFQVWYFCARATQVVPELVQLQKTIEWPDDVTQVLDVDPMSLL